MKNRIMQNSNSLNNCVDLLSTNNRNVNFSLASALQSNSNLNETSSFKGAKVFVASQEKMSDTILWKLKDQFENSENYLKEYDGLIIGKRARGPIEVKNNNEGGQKSQFILHSVVGGQKVIDNLKRYNLKKGQSKLLHKDTNASTINRVSSLVSKKKEKSSLGITFHMSKALKDNSTSALNSSKGNISYELADNHMIAELESKFRKIEEMNKTRHIIKEEKPDSNDSFEHGINYVNFHTTNSLTPTSRRHDNMNTITSSKNEIIKSGSNIGSTILARNQSFREEKPIFRNCASQNKFLEKAFNKESSSIMNKEVLVSVPYEFSRKLLQQEKTINAFEDKLEKATLLEKYLQERCKKRSRRDLLMNSGDSYLFKKEIINIIDSKVPPEVKKGNFNWIISLRKPKDFVGQRSSIINIGNENQPLWQYYREVSPIPFEKVFKPTVNAALIRSNQFNSINSKSKEFTHEFSGLDDCVVSIYYKNVSLRVATYSTSR